MHQDLESENYVMFTCIPQIHRIKLSLFNSKKRGLLKTFYRLYLLNKSYCYCNNESMFSIYLRKSFIVLKILMKMKICKCTNDFANSIKMCILTYICTL